MRLIKIDDVILSHEEYQELVTELEDLRAKAEAKRSYQREYMKPYMKKRRANAV